MRLWGSIASHRITVHSDTGMSQMPDMAMCEKIHINPKPNAPMGDDFLWGMSGGWVVRYHEGSFDRGGWHPLPPPLSRGLRCAGDSV